MDFCKMVIEYLIIIIISSILTEKNEVPLSQLRQNSCRDKKAELKIFLLRRPHLSHVFDMQFSRLPSSFCRWLKFIYLQEQLSCIRISVNLILGLSTSFHLPLF